MLPNFLIVGAPRSGTTLLQLSLAQHPEIYLATAQGEIYYPGDPHFFDVGKDDGRRNYEKGIAWYESLFDNVSNERAIGEKTADYLADPQAPALIKRHLSSDIRLIAVLRNPVDAAYSRYWHEKANIGWRMGFLEACRSEATRNIRLIDSGFYYRNITRYLDRFPREQFHILIYDDLISNPMSVLRGVFAFLGVNEAFMPAYSGRRVNTAIARGLPYHLKMSGGAMKKRFPALFRAMKAMPWANTAKRALMTARGLGGTRGTGDDSGANEKQYADLPSSVREELVAVYHEDTRNLGELVQRDLSSLWFGAQARH